MILLCGVQIIKGGFSLMLRHRLHCKIERAETETYLTGVSSINQWLVCPAWCCASTCMWLCVSAQSFHFPSTTSKVTLKYSKENTVWNQKAIAPWIQALCNVAMTRLLQKAYFHMHVSISMQQTEKAQTHCQWVLFVLQACVMNAVFTMHHAEICHSLLHRTML